MTDQVQEATKKMIANLKVKTGKSLEQWHKELTAHGFDNTVRHGELLRFLKTECAVTHGYANLIARKFLEAPDASEKDLVAEQYQGEKNKLLPIYEKLIRKILLLGADVSVAPKKSYVSLRRGKQFAIIQASTKTRLDIGINLGDTSSSTRLEKAGSFNSMVSHRVRVENLQEIDAELLAWLKQAYNGAA